MPTNILHRSAHWNMPICKRAVSGESLNQVWRVYKTGKIPPVYRFVLNNIIPVCMRIAIILVHVVSPRRHSFTGRTHRHERRWLKNARHAASVSNKAKAAHRTHSHIGEMSAFMYIVCYWSSHRVVHARVGSSALSYFNAHNAWPNSSEARRVWQAGCINITPDPSSSRAAHLAMLHQGINTPHIRMMYVWCFLCVFGWDRCNRRWIFRLIL